MSASADADLAPAMPKPKDSWPLRWIIIIFCLCIGFLSAGLVLAWPPFLELLLSAGAYEGLCTSRGLPVECDAQLLRLSIVFVAGSATIRFSAVLLGPVLDRFGPQYTVMLTLLLSALGVSLFGVSAQTGVDLFIPASILISLGFFVQVGVLSVSNLFPLPSLAVSAISMTVTGGALTVLVWYMLLHLAIGLPMHMIMYLHAALQLFLCAVSSLILPRFAISVGDCAYWHRVGPLWAVRYYQPQQLAAAQPVLGQSTPGGQPPGTSQLILEHVLTPSGKDQPPLGKAPEDLEPTPDLERPNSAFAAADTRSDTVPAMGDWRLSGTQDATFGSLSAQSFDANMPLITAGNPNRVRRNSIRGLHRFRSVRHFLTQWRFWVLLVYLVTTNWRIDFYISNVFSSIHLMVAQRGPGTGSMLIPVLSGILLPLSPLFNPLVGQAMARWGELNIVLVAAVVFLVFNIAVLIPNYVVQFVGFLMYLLTRPLLFPTFWSLLNRFCESNVFGRAASIIMLFAGTMSLTIFGLTALSFAAESFVYVQLFFLVVNLLIFFVPFLLRAPRKHEAGADSTPLDLESRPNVLVDVSLAEANPSDPPVPAAVQAQGGPTHDDSAAE